MDRHKMLHVVALLLMVVSAITVRSQTVDDVIIEGTIVAIDNVRVTFTTKEETEASVATLEEQSATREEGNFTNYSDAVRLYSEFFDHTHDASGTSKSHSAGVAGTAGYAALLRGGSNERYGLAKSLSVMPGDKIKMEM